MFKVANKGLNVLSLFDGISCGQQALKELGIKVSNYFASEICKSGIRCTMVNHPNTIQLGDVNEIDLEGLPKIDLLIGGSPCQGFSKSGKGLNFKDSRSKLFFKFVEVLKDIKPKYFLLENVVMRQEWQDVISNFLGVEPVLLDSRLTSAQCRKRLYWANFPISNPKDLGVNLADVLEDLPQKNKAVILGRRIDCRGKRQDYNKSVPITQCLEVRKSNLNKSNCLTTVSKDNVLTSLGVGRHPKPYKRKLDFRYYTKIERCRLMGLPDNYCDMLSYNQAVKATGNGWEVGMIKHIFKYIKNEEG